MHEFAFKPIEPISLDDFKIIITQLIKDAYYYKADNLIHIQLSENDTVGLVASRALKYITFEYTTNPSDIAGTLPTDFIEAVATTLKQYGAHEPEYCKDLINHRAIIKSGDLVMVITSENLV